MVKSASFSMPVDKGVIKRVAEGSKPIEAVFTAEQEEFLMTVARRKIDFGTLAVLGPLKAQRWRFEDPACPWPMTAELWQREDGQQLMEVSIKAPIVQAAAAIGGFMALPGRGGRRARRQRADQDPLGAGLLTLAQVAAGQRQLAGPRSRSPPPRR